MMIHDLNTKYSLFKFDTNILCAILPQRHKKIDLTAQALFALREHVSEVYYVI